MEKIFKLKNRKYSTVILLGLLVLVVEVILMSRPITNSISMIMNQGKPSISTSEALFNVPFNEKVVLDSEFLEASGFGYYKGDKLVQDYTLGAFEDEYIVIVQPLDRGVRKTVLVENNVKIVGKRIYDYDSQKARTMLIEDFAEYYEFSEEEASEYFAPEIFEFIGVVGDVTLWPLLIVVGTAMGVIGLAAFVKTKHKQKIKEVLQYDEALEIADQIDNPEYLTKNAIIIDKYIINKTGWNAESQFINKENIAWAYMHTLRNSYYGIPVHKTHSLMLYVNGSKKPIQIVMKESQVQDMLELLNAMEHEVVIGYTQEWLPLWNQALNKVGFMQLIFDTQESA